jgi:hypothetical protein
VVITPLQHNPSHGISLNQTPTGKRSGDNGNIPNIRIQS